MQASRTAVPMQPKPFISLAPIHTHNNRTIVNRRLVGVGVWRLAHRRVLCTVIASVEISQSATSAAIQNAPGAVSGMRLRNGSLHRARRKTILSGKQERRGAGEKRSRREEEQGAWSMEHGAGSREQEQGAGAEERGTDPSAVSRPCWR